MYIRFGPALLSLISLLIPLIAGSFQFLRPKAYPSEILQPRSVDRSVVVMTGLTKNGSGLGVYGHPFVQPGLDSRTALPNRASPLNLLLGAAIDFGGKDSYVDFGNPAKLHLTNYTIECWFRQDGRGVSITTGKGGMTRVVPLVVRGSDEGETNLTDINYFLGIDTTQNLLAFDFEEGSGGANPNLNHPIFGKTPITNGVWYHAAATYDGTTMRLYLNGTLDNELSIARPVGAASNAYASIGSALTSSGKTSGYFNGAIDEVRIWNRALSQAEIRTNLTQKISSATNLIARWGFDEGSGVTVSDSAVGVTPVNGAIKGMGYTWTDNSPTSMNYPPDPSTGSMPVDGALGVSTSPTLAVQVSDPEKDPLTVNFYGRLKTISFGPPFTYVVLPDTQTYTTSESAAVFFNSQTQWIVDNRSIRNIPFVSHLGDITENGGKDLDESEWIIANTAMSKLELDTPDSSDDIPFGVIPGNHDVLNGLTLYEKYFGVARFSGRPYYGGYYESDNANNFSLFSASGLNFIVLNLNCGSSTPSSAVLSWAGGLLRNNPNRRGIVTCHYVVGSGNPGSFSSAGKAIYNALKVYHNLFLMLGGHIGNEAQRQDIYNGFTVYSLLQDYQNIGKGWLRLMEFIPSASQIHVRTYSPYLNQYQTDANSDFTLPYDMGLAYTLIGSVSVPSGTSVASLTWSGLGSSTAYEWYVVVTDAQGSTIGQTNSFTTAGQNQPPVAYNDYYGVPENTTLVVSSPGVLVNDTQSSDRTLTAIRISNPVNGTLTLNPNGAFTYQPTSNWYGTDSFTYKTNDGLADSNVATVTITINPVNYPPVADAKSVRTDLNLPLPITLMGTDVDGDSLSYIIVSQPANGVLSGTPPSLTYAPNQDWIGVDSFTYKVNDGQLDSNIATVTITVNAVNSAPICSDLTLNTAENAPGEASPNCTDAEGSPLTYSMFGQPSHGTASVVNGKLAYTPAPYYNGTDSFTYMANDGQADSAPANVSVTISAVNYNPVAVNDGATTHQNTPLTINVLMNDTDPDQDVLSVVSTTNPANGIAVINPDYSITYTPNASFLGSDTFTYTVSDGFGGSSTGLVSITVTGNIQTTTLTYTGATSGQYSDQALLSAKLVDSSGNWIAGATISFSIGSQNATAITGVDGIASPILTLNQLAGSYTVLVNFSGTGSYQASATSQAYTITLEDAYVDYTKDLIVLYGGSNNLVATVWDSAANGYEGINPETAQPGMGDISKIWVAFDIYSIANCGKSPPATTKYAQVIDTGIAGDGIGTAIATTSRSENTYCVIVRLVADATGATASPWYRANRSQPAGLVAYKVVSPEAVGSGWIDDPSGGKGNFAFSTKISNSAPSGKFFYGYRGLYNGELADFLIQSTSITSLSVSGTTFPRTGNLAGKGSVQVQRVIDGVVLYNSSNMTFTAVVTDAGANLLDSFSIVILVNNAPYKNIPTIPVKGGDIIVN